jgi:hypothetical protein
MGIEMKFYLAILFIVFQSTSSTLAITPSNKGYPAAYPFSQLSVMDFLKLSLKDISLITGKKIRLFERLSFSILKLKMKYDLKKRPDLSVTEYCSKTRKKTINTLAIILIVLGSLLLLLIIIGLAGFSVN